MDDMIKNWDRLLPLTFYYDHLYAEEQKQISQALNEFYFNNEPPNLDEHRDNLTNVRTFCPKGNLHEKTLFPALE